MREQREAVLEKAARAGLAESGGDGVYDPFYLDGAVGRDNGLDFFSGDDSVNTMFSFGAILGLMGKDELTVALALINETIKGL